MLSDPSPHTNFRSAGLAVPLASRKALASTRKSARPTSVLVFVMSGNRMSPARPVVVSRRMGQLVAVTEKPSSLQPSIVRFELNRALTGMGHEHFTSAADALGPRPAAELAR